MFPRPATRLLVEDRRLDGSLPAGEPLREVGRREAGARAARGRGGRARCASASSGSSSSHVPKRRRSRYAIRVPSSSSSTARSWLAGSYRKPPVIRRWTSSTCPLVEAHDEVLAAPLDRVDALAGEPRRDRTPARRAGSAAGRRCVAATMRRPSSRAASRPRSVSTSGSSGTVAVASRSCRARSALRGRVVAELVRGQHLGRDRLGGGRRRRVRGPRRARLPRHDLVAALLAADDARRSSRSDPPSSAGPRPRWSAAWPICDRAEPRTTAGRRRRHLADDRAPRERSRGRGRRPAPRIQRS